jgi:NCS1 family nucleobase:cation symporter-1
VTDRVVQASLKLVLDCDVASFFTPAGTYGRLAWRGLLAYLIGLAAELPFVSQPEYTGWLVKPLGGADISWLVGWIIAAGVYLYLYLASGTRQASRPSRPAVAPVG